VAPELIGIVGAGPAGGRAAGSLRERGFEGRLVLLGDELEPPYERPPLSKAYLTGELPRRKLWLRGPEFYAEHGIEWRPGIRAASLEVGPGRLRLSDGEPLDFDRLLLATGSRPRRVELPGAGLPGVLTYRDVSDADQLRAALLLRPRVLVLGGGFLGSELAATARRLDCEVTVVETAGSLLAPLGAEASGFCAGLHRQAGVDLRLHETVCRFEGGARLEEAVLGGGETLPCDLALICVGAEPNSGLAQQAGLATDPGVVVDGRCQAAGTAVFAAGDVASWWSRRWHRRLRLEHHDNALQQGTFVAGALLGEAGDYDPIPYFWSEQYDAIVQQVGLLGPAGATVLRGDPRSGSFSVFHLEGARLGGCVAVNRFPDLSAARRLIASGAPVPADVLRDPTIDLRDWSRGAAEAAVSP
jgi:3-phenylpropionate/trans-cinnamate dioxygenase ferredoxin reductase subunit